MRSRSAYVSSRSKKSSASSRIRSAIDGSATRAAISSGVNGVSSFGNTQFAVRWYTSSRAASAAISGIICTAAAALPITATALPRRSSPLSGQAPEWTVGPAKSSRPRMSGQRSLLNMPSAVMKTSEEVVQPSPVAMRHADCASSQTRLADLGAVPDVGREVVLLARRGPCSRGSPAGSRTGATSRPSARRRTSRRATGRRTTGRGSGSSPRCRPAGGTSRAGRSPRSPPA